MVRQVWSGKFGSVELSYVEFWQVRFVPLRLVLLCCVKSGFGRFVRFCYVRLRYVTSGFGR